MALADRVLPEHIQRAWPLEKQLREYMQNQKILLCQCDRAMATGDITAARELKKLSDKQLEESNAVEKELIELYKKKQKRDQEHRNEERKNVLDVADRLESIGGNPVVVEQIRKNA
ncbi:MULTISPECIES: hypothetical protein [Bacillus cereus group]|uniref:hypothetical protein n=1 Tax=Bacillus cereus group TaxID=86661 RepID=UPI001298B9D6|nr:MULTISPECIES: hypothetical protein [Bacillus cereus group]MEB8712022.1 hypothetical protein [Bacillus cereus]MDR5046511.1 hypothetical protein [Bacillus thuringiensis]MEB8859224.1 hypothetical protein [Bacillus cereus]MEB9434647.1 hypothetical protein [Bacillus cereus]MEB9481916.1 hypothetical protein [Bacillus cereus]